MSEQKNSRIPIAIVIAGILIAGAILAPSLGVLDFIKETMDPFADVKKAVANELIDPKSVEFRALRTVKVGEYCGEVNGKNRMGAYTGFRQFHALFVTQDTKWSIFIDNDNIFDDAKTRKINKLVKEWIDHDCTSP